MDIPAPQPLGARATLALGAPCGWIAREHLDQAIRTGRAPVILQRLGGEKERLSRGPRELGEAACAALERNDWTGDWGLGGMCRETEEAAQFATAGHTWFTFDLTAQLEPRAGTMSLDELDATIVALEDAGCYRAEWHADYLDTDFDLEAGGTFRFTEDQLARAAVKFGRALLHAGQLQQAVLANWTGCGTLPDFEITIARAPDATTPDEFLFFSTELWRRGIGSAIGSRIAPSFGRWFQPGTDGAPSLPPASAQLRTLCPNFFVLSVPATIGHLTGWEHAHWDLTGDAPLAVLRLAAERDPALFREWLLAARDAFPTARAGWNISTSEDDVRFLPEVADAALATTFLEQRQGRQLLLATWEDVAPILGERLRQRLAMIGGC